MATATGNYVCDCSTLINFKSWAQAISAAFAAFGWTQTADSGQVNWTTIVAVPSSTYVYEIWKAADAQATTLPIYLKVEYGFNTSTPRIRITVGTSSDGSGNINSTAGTTGPAGTPGPWLITNDDTNYGGTTFPCYFSGNAGEFRMYMWSTTSHTPGMVFGIERSKDSSGNNTTAYFTVLTANSLQAYSSTVGNRQQTILSSTLFAPYDFGIHTFGPNVSGTGAFNGTVAAFPVFPVFGQVGNPMLGFMSAIRADVSDGSQVTVASMYGGTHTYVGCSPSNGVIFGENINYASLGGYTGTLLMRYE